MRYISDWHFCYVALRFGVLAVVDPTNVGETLALTTELDPANVGRMLHRSALPRSSVGPRPVVDDTTSHKLAASIGATGWRNFTRTAALLYVSSDGNETRFEVNRPGSPAFHDNIEFPGLSASPVVPISEIDDAYLVLGKREDRTNAWQRLMIAPWRDPEVLGQAIMNIFWMVEEGDQEVPHSLFGPSRITRRSALHMLALEGDVGALPKRVPRVDPTDSLGETPLMLAAARGHAMMVQRLLALRAKPNLQDKAGGSPLHHGARAGNADVAKLLLAAGADTSLVDVSGRTALHTAALGGQGAYISELVATGADPNASDDSNHSSPLHLAARVDHGSVVANLVGGGGLVDQANKEGRTPLHVAAAYGHLEMVRSLLAAGAAVSPLDNRGETPLHGAAFSEHMDCLEQLVAQGADVSAVDGLGNTPLHVAAGMNRTEAVASLITAGAEIEARNIEGLTAMDLAIINPHFDALEDSVHYREHNTQVARVLTACGASIDPDRLPIGDRHGLCPQLTPPQLLDSNRDLDIVLLPEVPIAVRQELAAMSESERQWRRLSPVSKGAPTILHQAVQQNEVGLMVALLNAGASPTTAVRHWDTPLHWAVRWRNREAAELLVGRGANLEMPEPTPYAVRAGLEGNSRYFPGMETPLDEAIQKGDPDMVRFLLTCGAVPPVSREEVGRRKSEYGQSQRDLERELRLFHPLQNCPEDKRQAIIDLFGKLDLPI